MFWIIAALIGGYVAAIFTWPAIRTGAAAAIASLRERTRAIKSKIKGFTGR